MMKDDVKESKSIIVQLIKEEKIGLPEPGAEDFFFKKKEKHSLMI